MEIRRIQAGEALALRDVRLRALADAPSAFGSTYATSVTRPDSYWLDWAREGAAGIDRVTYVVLTAPDDARLYGLASGLLLPLDVAPATQPPAHRKAELVAVWVDPALRGGGAAAALIHPVITWARQRGAPHIELWVVRDNVSATALYRRAGFQSTGELQPLPSDPSMAEIRMVKML